MIILEDCPDSSSGGSELSLLDLAKRSPKPIRLLYRNSGDLLPKYQAAGCDTVPIGIENYRLAESFKYLLKENNIGDGTIYVNHYHYLVFAALKKVLYGGQVFCHLRLPPLEHFGVQLKFAFKLVDHFIVVSDFTKRQWQSQLGGDNYTTIHNGVEVNDFPCNVSRFLQPTIFFASRNVPYKGLNTLIQAFEYLPERYRLFVLGDHKRSSTERIRFLGHVGRQQLPNIMAKCHLAVMPSEWPEPFGRVLIEAMACNLPAIGASVGGIPEVVMDETHLFSPGNPYDLAQKIQQKMTSSLNYRSYAQENFNINTQAQKIFDLIYS
jgi:glycosyltransferase involved in cell wall biosynthesis